jgi:serine/threonine protein kinase
MTKSPLPQPQLDHLEIGDMIDDRYKIVGELSKGGFGKTFLAEDCKKFDDICVVKQFTYQRLENKQEARDLFREEAKILLDLESYSQAPNLLAYIDEKDCIIQEFIQGQDLHQELEQQGKFSEEEILELLSEALPVLKFIHDKGIIHKDIKPSHFIRKESNGKLVLIDFGIAKRLEEPNLISESNLNIIMNGAYSFPSGTIGFQSPDSHSSPSSDLYSLGATCIQLLTGDTPKSLEDNFGERWVNKWQNCTDEKISNPTYIFIKKLLSSNTSDRFQSAEEALQELESIEYIRRKNEEELSTLLLSSSVNHYKSQAINALADFGQEAKNAIPDLIKLLKSQDDQISSNAWNALVKIGSESVIPLTELLEDKRVGIRRKAVSALEQLGTDASAATSHLILALEDSDPEGDVRWYATIAIGKIGLPAKEAIPSLIKRLRDEKSGIRAYASWALGKMGLEAKDAIPVLLETLKDENSGDAFLAGLEALEVIGYDVSTININFDDGTTSNAKEHIIFQREEQAKALESQRNSSGGSGNKGIRYLEWRRPLSANTPPQNPQPLLKSR